jgi:hypothetical protein
VLHELTEQQRKQFVLFRFYEASREIGVLLIAFSPLDASFSQGGLSASWMFFLAYGLGGILLFAYGVLGERRIHGGDERPR